MKLNEPKTKINLNENENNEEIFIMPDEGICSAEFKDGCIFPENTDE